MRQSILAETMLKLRKDAGYTQEDLGRKLNIQRQTYCNYENESRTPPLEIIIALAKLYQVSVDYLVCGTENTEGKSLHTVQNSIEGRLVDGFSSLSGNAQKEVLDFIQFKKIYSE